jgi:hypothetical protein
MQNDHPELNAIWTTPRDIKPKPPRPFMGGLVLGVIAALVVVWLLSGLF